ncbi:baseplate J/gp47 family protein [Mesorhizobium sp. 1M-11]|uniref:baseplate J/gp47 family protein n=1 Tax=Mesorhizobium sp. 1M-11 TaxID=1529006 RepID=UPI0006C774EC|nr:baseplate J/gp47 family protein [Mesorhizobium sp. 1M-11]
MAFPLRSLDEISRTVRGAFRQYMPGTDASLRINITYVIAKAISLLAREYELRFGWLHRNMFLWSADNAEWVSLLAADIGIWTKPASAASGVVTGTGAANQVYPAGIRFSSGGQTFVTTAAVTADDAGALAFPVLCEQTGASTNRDVGAVLMLADPSLEPTLSQEFTVATGGLGGGADAETLEALRSRALQRKRNPPRAGALSDYEEIALSVAGVVKAWAFRVPASPGAVTVLFLFAGRANSIPLAGDVAAVQAAIDARRLIRVDASEHPPRFRCRSTSRFPALARTRRKFGLPSRPRSGQCLSADAALELRGTPLPSPEAGFRKRSRPLPVKTGTFC